MRAVENKIFHSYGRVFGKLTFTNGINLDRFINSKIAAVVVSSLILASCGSAVSKSASSTTFPTTANTTASTTSFAVPPVVDQGLLPQTKEKPTAQGAGFDANVQLLWNAIVEGDPQSADQFFFPLASYIQVKAISDPVHDYDTRLIFAYDTDLLAYHQELLKLGGAPKLIGLSVPSSQAQWILPGVEYNKGSYWRVYGSKLYFSVGGVTHSFPIYSLISWRGKWYVVHVGPPT